jgi:hypothetical protein
MHTGVVGEDTLLTKLAQDLREMAAARREFIQ